MTCIVPYKSDITLYLKGYYIRRSSLNLFVPIDRFGQVRTHSWTELVRRDTYGCYETFWKIRYG